MSTNHEFGVWMDTQQAIVVVSNNNTSSIVGHVKSDHASNNSSEKNFNNNERNLETKFFKEIATHIQNATHVHVTGTGKIQEQFINFLKDTPQFKNTKTEESTSNKMSDEKLIEFMDGKLK